MAIFTASFFEPDHHHGSKIAISRSLPRKVTVDDRLEFLAPSTALLRDWHQGITEEATSLVIGINKYPYTQSGKNTEGFKECIESLQDEE